MDEESESIGNLAYDQFILEKWYNICELSDDLQIFITESGHLKDNEIDDKTQETFDEYRGLLTRMWRELQPHVSGNDKIAGKEEEKKFKGFRQATFKPSDLTMERAFELEMLIGKILYNLGFTKHRGKT